MGYHGKRLPDYGPTSWQTPREFGGSLTSPVATYKVVYDIVKHINSIRLEPRHLRSSNDFTSNHYAEKQAAKIM
jgi:hypothetical protein